MQRARRCNIKHSYQLYGSRLACINECQRVGTAEINSSVTCGVTERLFSCWRRTVLNIVKNTPLGLRTCTCRIQGCTGVRSSRLLQRDRMLPRSSCSPGARKKRGKTREKEMSRKSQVRCPWYREIEETLKTIRYTLHTADVKMIRAKKDLRSSTQKRHTPHRICTDC